MASRPNDVETSCGLHKTSRPIPRRQFSKLSRSRALSPGMRTGPRQVGDLKTEKENFARHAIEALVFGPAKIGVARAANASTGLLVTSVRRGAPEHLRRHRAP